MSTAEPSAWLPRILASLKRLGADPPALARSIEIAESRARARGRPVEVRAFVTGRGVNGPRTGVAFREGGRLFKIVEPDGFVWDVYPGDP